MAELPDRSSLVDDPVFWTEILKRLSFSNLEYDTDVIASLQTELNISARRVLDKLKATYRPDLTSKSQ